MHFRGKTQRLASVTCFAADLQLQRQIPAILQVDYWVAFDNSKLFFNSAFRSIILHLVPCLLFSWEYHSGEITDVHLGTGIRQVNALLLLYNMFQASGEVITILLPPAIDTVVKFIV